MVTTELAEPTGQAQKVQTRSAWTTDSRTPPAVVVMSPHTAAVAPTGRNPAGARSTDAATASTTGATAPGATAHAATAPDAAIFCRAAADAVCNQAVGATNFSITVASRLGAAADKSGSTQLGRKIRHPLVQSTAFVSDHTTDAASADASTIVASLSRCPGLATTF